MPESNGYSHISPEEIARRIDTAKSPVDRHYWEDIEAEYQDTTRWEYEIITTPDGIGIQTPSPKEQREQHNREWNERKKQYHLDNLAGLNGIWHGTMFINGIGQARG